MPTFTDARERTMNESKHTPGPWVARAGIGRWNVVTAAGARAYNICAINTDRLEQEANAQLIAAAPELLLDRDALLNAARALCANLDKIAYRDAAGLRANATPQFEAMCAAIGRVTA